VKSERIEVSVIEQLRDVSRVRVVDGGNIPFPLVRRKHFSVSEGDLPIEGTDYRPEQPLLRHQEDFGSISAQNTTHGVWWNIAGAGWVSGLPDHFEQLELFEGCRHPSKYAPFWGGAPLAFTEEQAKELAEKWSGLGWGPYVAKVLPTK
jgi:hypothetical protein